MMDSGSELYARFLSGDESALRDLIEAYRVGMICFIDQMVQNPSVAESIAEDVFVQLAVKKPKDRGTASFKTWIYTIAHHRTVSYLRVHARRETLCIDDLPDLENNEDTPEQAFIKDERDRAVHAALQKIKPIYREVLWLMYFENKPCAEIGTILRKSTHNIETIASRARAALRNIWKEEGFTYEII